MHEGETPYSKEVVKPDKINPTRMFFTVEFTCGDVKVIPGIRVEGLKYPVLTQMPVSLANVKCWACRENGTYLEEVEELTVTDLEWECTSDNGETWSYFYDDKYSVSDSPIRYGYKYRVSFTVHPKETACGNVLAPLVGDTVKEEKNPHTVFSTTGFSSYNSSFVFKWAECIDNGDGSFTFRSYHRPEEYKLKYISTSMQNYAAGMPADNVGATSSTAGIDVSKVELVTREGSEDTKAIGNIEPFTEYWAKVSLSITGDNQKIYEFTDYNYLKDYHGVDSERYIEYRDAIKLNGIKADDIIQDKDGSFSDDYNITVYFKLPMFVSDKAVKLSTTNYTYSGGVKTPAVSIIDANGNKISSDNYSVSYATGRKSVGKYKVTVTFKGDKYSGSKYTYFYINPKGTSISQVTGAKKAFTVKWKKQSSKMATSTITGYQIRYSTSFKMTSAKTKTVKGYKSTSKKITKLSAKKKYYVQVRTYKTVSGKTYYSSWSGIKSVKTK